MTLPYKLFAYCAFLLLPSSARAVEVYDPLEPLNRHIFTFNESVDDFALKPVAVFYQTHTPQLLQDSVGNFFGNVSDIWSTANLVLQGRYSTASASLKRVAVNTTLGILGVKDAASAFGLQKQPADFGQTMGHWGIPAGPYLVLPILGPATLRDAAGRGFDMGLDPWNTVGSDSVRNSGVLVRLTQHRTNMMSATSLVDDIALDKYTFIRDGYVQHRQSLVVESMRD